MSTFDEFWGVYPRKVGKALAMRAYARALKGLLPIQVECELGPATHEEIMAGVSAYRRDKPDYCDWKHGSTFLNQASWIDEGGSEVIDDLPPVEPHLELKRREHESGQAMHPSLAAKYGWAEFASVVRPALRVVG